MSVRKRAWLTGQGEEKIAWVVDFKDLIGARRLRTFRLKKKADRFATKVRADHLDTELNAKSPARIAVLPSHGSTNPGKEKEMNSTKATTGSAEAPAPLDLSAIFKAHIDNAQRMSSILATLLEANLKRDMSGVIGGQGKDSYFINRSDVEDMLFSIYKIQDFVGHINTAFLEATA